MIGALEEFNLGQRREPNDVVSMKELRRCAKSTMRSLELEEESTRIPMLTCLFEAVSMKELRRCAKSTMRSVEFGAESTAMHMMLSLILFDIFLISFCEVTCTTRLCIYENKKKVSTRQHKR